MVSCSFNQVCTTRRLSRALRRQDRTRRWARRLHSLVSRPRTSRSRLFPMATRSLPTPGDDQKPPVRETGPASNPTAREVNDGAARGRNHLVGAFRPFRRSERAAPILPAEHGDEACRRGLPSRLKKPVHVPACAADEQVAVGAVHSRLNKVATVRAAVPVADRTYRSGKSRSAAAAVDSHLFRLFLSEYDRGPGSIRGSPGKRDGGTDESSAERHVSNADILLAPRPRSSPRVEFAP